VLAIVLVVTSLVSAGDYLPIIAAVWMKPGPANPSPLRWAVPRSAMLAIGLATALILVFGVWPGPILEWATTSALSVAGAAAPLVGAGIP
jgi:NADH:ubiquinone oxidoreductase subunit 2 (subunit N)